MYKEKKVKWLCVSRTPVQSTREWRLECRVGLVLYGLEELQEKNSSFRPYYTSRQLMKLV